MEASANSKTISELKTLIEDRIYKYYPELTSQQVHIKGTLFKKCHQSIIYQFDIYNSKAILKSVIVKKRIHNKFYNNHVMENTEKELDILKYLNNLPNSKVSAPRVLDAIPEEGLLITEKVNGESLYSFLRRAFYLPITKSKKLFAKQIFSKTGQWLRDFHNASFEGEKGRIDTQEFIEKAKQIVDKFPSMGLPIDLGNALINKMEKLEKDVLTYAFPISYKHGDFQPLNIIFREDKITVFDIHAKNKDIAIKDVCNFITGSIIMRIKLPFSFFNGSHLNEMVEEFLRTYYQDEIISRPAIEFVKTLGLLEQLNNIYERNRNFIKRKILISFYNNEIKELVRL